MIPVDPERSENAPSDARNLAAQPIRRLRTYNFFASIAPEQKSPANGSTANHKIAAPSIRKGSTKNAFGPMRRETSGNVDLPGGRNINLILNGSHGRALFPAGIDPVNVT
ncbi:MAG TPA: hypothetical protein VNW28_10040 [Chthoniobacterales bacterium]|nr:hypothetical protein [Chthoniobacterales bacterium]